jgi:uncharacterized protein (DUF736 family)
MNKDGKGYLFKNTKKMSEKSPDFNGAIQINGIEYKFSGWKSKAKSGMDYISLSLKTSQSQNTTYESNQESSKQEYSYNKSIENESYSQDVQDEPEDIF